MIYSPFQSLNLDGLQIAYRTIGQGPDVLLLHGWASSSRMWQRLMNDLAGHYRCTAVDLPGFGDSDKPAADWYSTEQYVQVTGRIAFALGLETPILVGHSMGGMIALAAAGQAAFPAARVVAINPIVTGRSYMDLRLLANSLLGAPMMSLGGWIWPIASGDWARSWLGNERAFAVRRRREEWRQCTAVSLIEGLRTISQTDLTPLLPRIALPTLIVLGSRDITAPNAEGKLAARQVPGAQLVVLPSGHLPTDDLPVETHAVLEKFLVADLILSEAGSV